MHKICAFINDNQKKFSFSLSLNIIFFILFNVFFYCQYHTVDDVFMEMIACGAFGSPDAHLIYINAILGFVLKCLYSLAQNIPWYTLMQIVMSILSFSVILYVFFNREQKGSAILALLAILAISYEAYVRVQFTKTAAFLTVAGYVLISFSVLRAKDRRWLWGTILLVNGYMMRPGMFFACSAVCLGFLMPIVLKALKKNRSEKELKDMKRLFAAGLCSLLLVGASFFIDRLCYSSDEWKYYKHYNEYITQLEDINFPDYSSYEDEYKKLDISYEDYLLYSAMDQNDPELFGIDKMEKVKDLQPHKTMNIDEFIEFLLKGKNKFFKERSMTPFTAILLSVLLYFVFVSRNGWIEWFSLFFVGFAAFVCFFYTYMMHRWLDRTTISVVFATVFSLLSLINEKKETIKKVFVSLMIVAMTLSYVRCWENSLKWKMNDWTAAVAKNHEALDEIYKDQDHLYIGRTSLALWKAYYTPYEAIRLGAMSNFSPLGDWLTNAPFSVGVLENYGIKNPYKDIVDNKKAYLIGDRGSLEPVLNYIIRHYDPNAEMRSVRMIGEYEVFSIVSAKQ